MNEATLECIRKWFAAELKDRMDENKFRPYHLMTLCKMTETEILECLEGTTLPGLYSLVMMADRLECTVDDLLGYDEPDEPDVYERYAASSMFFTESQYAVCLADRARQYLENRFMCVSDLAKKLELTPSACQRWFSRTRPHLPSTARFLQICEALDCTPSELLGY